ncbi:hypothetical protein [Streptococcus pneumoniae]|uniref:hypothetical protein n=1 Tax=Streptococcus pneumoniae TaxID=1313 RepID=UPI0018789C2F|nr:hypothetical protein [Streptococcus pneumoniae]
MADKTDEVSSKHRFEVAIELTKSAQNTVLRLPDKTDEVSNIYLRQGDVDVV